MFASSAKEVAPTNCSQNIPGSESSAHRLRGNEMATSHATTFVALRAYGELRAKWLRASDVIFWICEECMNESSFQNKRARVYMGYTCATSQTFLGVFLYMTFF